MLQQKDKFFILFLIYGFTIISLIVYAQSQSEKESKKIKRIELNEDSICKIQNFREFSNLNHLTIVTKKFDCVNGKIYNFKKLEVLYLCFGSSANEFGGKFHFKDITYDGFNHIQIKKNNVTLGGIPNDIQYPTELRALSIVCGKLKNLPKELTQLKELYYLTLQYNHIDNSDGLDPLFEMQNLGHLDISVTNISEKKISQNIHKLSRLKYLRLDCTILDDYSVLYQFFLPKFKHLSIEILDYDFNNTNKKNKAEWLKEYEKIKASSPDFHIYYSGSYK